MAKKKSAIEDGQSEINIGLVGHVDHGKTTLTERLSGKWTDTHSEELKRGITIRLGYADTIIYQCSKCKKFGVNKKCSCGEEAKAVRKVSFIDAPGHESLMATMIGGAALMDGALLMIAANEECPQPQTREHLMTLGIVGIKNIIVVQSKIDLVSEEKALKNYKEIKAFLKGTDYENAQIIPISAKFNINMELLVKAMQETFLTPSREEKKDALMFIARSFDINKPGSNPQDLVGGVLGGAIKQGKFFIGDQIEILPGRSVGNKNQKTWVPIKTKIIDMVTGGNKVKELVPGGSVAIMTSLDPAIVKSDTLMGGVIGKAGKMPPLWYNLKLNLHLLERIVGSKESAIVEPIKISEVLMLNINSSATVGIVNGVKKNYLECKLKLPVCAENGSRVTISRRVGSRFRLIGYGIISD